MCVFTFREIGKQKEKNLGNSLAVQWLGLRLSLWGPGFNFWSRNLIPQATQHSSAPPTPSPSKNKRNCCQSHHPNTTKGPYFRSSTLLENTQPSLSSPPLIYGTNQVFPQMYLEVLTEHSRIKPCIYNVLLYVCVRS